MKRYKIRRMFEGYIYESIVAEYKDAAIEEAEALPYEASEVAKNLTELDAEVVDVEEA